jgi:hypothetical protein
MHLNGAPKRKTDIMSIQLRVSAVVSALATALFALTVAIAPQGAAEHDGASTSLAAPSAEAAILAR